MKTNFYTNSIITALIVSVVFISIPQEAQARNLFRQFFHDIKRGVSFIVKLPDKTTRWMGPILGPIASGILTQNLAGHHKFGQIFNNARRANNAINDIEEQKRLTGEVRQMYRDQAGELRNYVKKLEEAREKLGGQLIGRDVSMHDYIQTVVELDKMIATVKQTAVKFDENADKIRTQDIVKLAASSLVNSVIGEIKNAALNELSDEVLDVINPDVIKLLIDRDSIGWDTLLEMVLTEQMDEYDGEFNIDELKDRVGDRVKQILAENKDGLKGNLKNNIKNILDGIIKDMGVVIIFVSGSLGLFIFIEKYILNDPLGLNFSGPAILAVIILFLVGIILVCLGLIALYIGNIQNEAMNRPLYVINEAKL